MIRSVYSEKIGLFGSHLSEVTAIDMNIIVRAGSNAPSAEKKSPRMHGIEIVKHRLKRKSHMLEIGKCRFKLLRFSKEKARELEKMRLENEKLRLEHERLELEMKLKEIEKGIK